MSIVTLVVTAFILTSVWNELVYFAYGFLTLLFITLVWWAVNFSLLAREDLLTKKAQRQIDQYRVKAAKYIDYQDGFGMKHLLNLDTNTVENLSTFPGSHHNGQYADPPPAAAAAWYALVGKVRAESPVNLLPATTQQESAPELLPLLDRAERVLIKGASDAGKTTLIQHTAIRATDEVIIVDPHYKPGIWPQCKVIGAGRNFTEITKFLQWLEIELDKRYKSRMAGNENWTRYTVIIDEYMSVAVECDNARRVLSAMIRESRKVGFRLFICSHSELLKPLGLDGQGDVRDGLLIVRLYYSQLRQERRATIDDGDGEVPCTFPPYYGAGSTELVTLDMPNLVIQLSEQESKVAQMLANGSSRSAIAKELFGHAGGNQLAQVDKIIDRISA